MPVKTRSGPSLKTRSSANRKFDRYKPELEKDVRKQSIEKCNILEELENAWSEVAALNLLDRRYSEGIMLSEIKVFEGIRKIVKDINSTADDIVKFCLILDEVIDRHPPYLLPFSLITENLMGLFISALMNKEGETQFKIPTSHLREPVNGLGFINRNNIIVQGDIGQFVGWRQESGMIIVNGNAANSVGNELNGGIITIEGNAGTGVGDRMKGGLITIKGDAEDTVGNGMRGGHIIIEGSAQYVGSGMVGGSIEVRGEFCGLSDNHLKGTIKHGEVVLR